MRFSPARRQCGFFFFCGNSTGTAQLVALLASPVRTGAPASTQFLTMIDPHALEALNTSIGENLANVSRLGARVVALSRFVAAAFPYLPATECAAVEQAFRQQINDAMSRTPDSHVPGGYEEALLDEVNALIAALKQRSLKSR